LLVVCSLGESLQIVSVGSLRG